MSKRQDTSALPRYTKVTVTSAELLAIAASPKTIIPARPDYTTIVHKALFVLNYGGTAYQSNGLLGLYETDNSGKLITGTLTLAEFLGATADTQKELVPNVSTTEGITRLSNKAIVLTQATGESTAGNSPVDVHVWYSQIPSRL